MIRVREWQVVDERTFIAKVALVTFEKVQFNPKNREIEQIILGQKIMMVQAAICLPSSGVPVGFPPAVQSDLAKCATFRQLSTDCLFCCFFCSETSYSSLFSDSDFHLSLTYILPVVE